MEHARRGVEQLLQQQEERKGIDYEKQGHYPRVEDSPYGCGRTGGRDKRLGYFHHGPDSGEPGDMEEPCT